MAEWRDVVPLRIDGVHPEDDHCRLREWSTFSQNKATPGVNLALRDSRQTEMPQAESTASRIK
jgi:hypothetical protein